MPVKPRCTFKECKTAAQRIVGDCGFCDGHFCAKHRLLEDHKCTGLEDVSLAQSTADSPDNTLRCGSPSSLESSSTGEPLQGTTQWWLCKKESHERNAAQLEAERTQVIRGVHGTSPPPRAQGDTNHNALFTNHHHHQHFVPFDKRMASWDYALEHVDNFSWPLPMHFIHSGLRIQLPEFLFLPIISLAWGGFIVARIASLRILRLSGNRDLMIYLK
ncbi:hypothetical protein FHL15_003989 [Xylaria flabelliformis]|uniref:AN1-type domain-containing protein n=1 Tax=Xylaria flabelliformis TaxID=2512241 RepID=A0A553I522_9PEZI|nr:hypothetical protein FHL15_003989 [Xylaria flabelliformis]